VAPAPLECAISKAELGSTDAAATTPLTPPVKVPGKHIRVYLLPFFWVDTNPEETGIPNYSWKYIKLEMCGTCFDYGGLIKVHVSIGLHEFRLDGIS